MKKLKMKHALPIALAVVLLSLSATFAIADPLFATGNTAVGDRYMITTASGEARTCIDGRLVTGPADLQLQVQVTFVGPDSVVFRALSGTFQVSCMTYSNNVGHRCGDYNRDSRTAIYQGAATAPDGRDAHFVLYGQSTSDIQQGVYMGMYSDFRGEYAHSHMGLTPIATNSTKYWLFVATYFLKFHSYGWVSVTIPRRIFHLSVLFFRP
jgi:hypothetical protein